MILDARQFENLVRLKEGLPNKGLPDVEYFQDGNLIILRLVDIRTYGGIIRFYKGEDAVLHSTGSSTIPMRIRRPFRLAASGVYVWYTHLDLHSLPSELMAIIMPTPEIADAGVYFTGGPFIGNKLHELKVTAMIGRQIEIDEDYPVALLGFMPQQVLENEKSNDSSRFDGLSESAFATERVSPKDFASEETTKEGIKNGKDSSSRSGKTRSRKTSN